VYGGIAAVTLLGYVDTALIGGATIVIISEIAKRLDLEQFTFLGYI